MKFIAHYRGEHENKDVPVTFCDGVFRTRTISDASAYSVLGFGKFVAFRFSEKSNVYDVHVNCVACNDKDLVIKCCFEI